MVKAKEFFSSENIREERHKLYKKWFSKDMRRSHPCPLCLKKCSWSGKLCDDCQEKLDIWCPCDVETTYWDSHHKKEVPATRRAPLPDFICSELCNRCGLRIQSIWELMEQTDSTENDDAIEKLIKDYEARTR